MAFTVPNHSVATFEAQSQLFSTDLAILGSCAGGANGVVSGCAVTAQGTPDMSVAVAVGSVVVNNAQVAVTAASVVITANPGASSRFDLIVASDAGALSAVAGTPATDPVPAALPADTVALAMVYVTPADDVISSGQIVDKRVSVPTPLGASGWTTVSKAADQAKTSDITLAADTTLEFAMAANTKYRIRGRLFVSYGAGYFKMRTSGPASPTRILTRIVTIGTGGLESSGRLESVYSATDLTVTAGTVSIVEFDIVITNGANAGDFELWWAQYVSNAAATTVLAGSYIEYEVA